MTVCLLVCWTFSVSSVVMLVYCVCMQMPLGEIRVGQPDGFNVTTRLWKRCIVEIWSKYKHAGAESSAQATADPLRGTDCYELDEKHIVTYILSCKAPPPLIMWLFCAERVKSAFMFEFKLKTEKRGRSNGRLCVLKKKRETQKASKHKKTRIKKIFVWEVLTVFVAGHRNVVDSSELETGAGQDLELHRTQNTCLEVWETHSDHTDTNFHFSVVQCVKSLNHFRWRRWSMQCFLRIGTVNRKNIKVSVTFLLEFLDAFSPLWPLIVRGEEEQVALDPHRKKQNS